MTRLRPKSNVHERLSTPVASRSAMPEAEILPVIAFVNLLINEKRQQSFGHALPAFVVKLILPSHHLTRSPTMRRPVPSHCSLCSFAFEENDATIPVYVKQPYDKQEPPRALPYCHSLVSSEIWLCHEDCFATTKPSDRQLLLGSSVFSFSPSPREEKQRLNFFRDCAAALVCSLLNFQCPLEVGLMVVRYLPRRFLSQVSVLHALRSHASRPSSRMEIKGTTGQGTIHVRHVEYQGRLYINSIQSADGRQLRRQRGDLLASYSWFDPENVIIIGSDHLGIRAVLLGRPTMPDPSETQGLWWRFAPKKRAGSSVRWRSDVSHLQDRSETP